MNSLYLKFWYILLFKILRQKIAVAIILNIIQPHTKRVAGTVKVDLLVYHAKALGGVILWSQYKHPLPLLDHSAVDPCKSYEGLPRVLCLLWL